MLARGRLADADRPGRCRDAALAIDLDEQPQAGRIPQQPERGIGHDNGSYRQPRLGRWHQAAYARSGDPATVPLRRHRVRELPVRLRDSRNARRRRPARGARTRLPGRGRTGRRPDRRRLRDARSGRPRLRAAGARRCNRCDRVPAGWGGRRVRARAAGRPRRGRARQHGRSRSIDSGSRTRPLRVRRERSPPRDGRAVARLHRRLAPRRRCRTPRPACGGRSAPAGPAAVRVDAAAARPARRRARLSEPLRRLGLRPSALRESVFLDRVRAPPQPGAATRRRGDLRRRAAPGSASPPAGQPAIVAANRRGAAPSLV